mmetsp:Transcript_1342/g.2882  ORF Transcript_1342/g.2882 Transcript_1342/m.2882 type:complete len:223 (-) Transcript_1342:256-924(-)
MDPILLNNDHFLGILRLERLIGDFELLAPCIIIYRDGPVWHDSGRCSDTSDLGTQEICLGPVKRRVNIHRGRQVPREQPHHTPSLNNLGSGDVRKRHPGVEGRVADPVGTHVDTYASWLSQVRIRGGGVPRSLARELALSDVVVGLSSQNLPPESQSLQSHSLQSQTPQRSSHNLGLHPQPHPGPGQHPGLDREIRELRAVRRARGCDHGAHVGQVGLQELG